MHIESHSGPSDVRPKCKSNWGKYRKTCLEPYISKEEVLSSLIVHQMFNSRSQVKTYKWYCVDTSADSVALII